MKISFIVPVFNEQDSLVELTARIKSAVLALPSPTEYEIVLVDDGSTDQSWSRINDLSQDPDNHIKALGLRRNFGKAAALSVGMSHVAGELVFTLDADLQDDPKEIGKFLQKLDEGYDMVSGWKRKRNDPPAKTAPSKLFNWVTAKLTGLPLNDFNSGFKCYRREVIDRLHIYGELHRYIPVLAADLGYRVAEVEVEHHARLYGSSKYGWERYARGLLDLITVLTITRWMQKPGHLFGGVGILLGIIGGTTLSYLFALWLLDMGPIGTRPLLLFGIMVSIFSLQMVSFGLIAEFIVRVRGPIDTQLLIKKTISTSAGKLPEHP